MLCLAGLVALAFFSEHFILFQPPSGALWFCRSDHCSYRYPSVSWSSRTLPVNEERGRPGSSVDHLCPTGSRTPITSPFFPHSLVTRKTFCFPSSFASWTFRMTTMNELHLLLNLFSACQLVKFFFVIPSYN